MFFTFINGNDLVFGFQLGKKWKMQTNHPVVQMIFNADFKALMTLTTAYEKTQT